MKNDYLTLELIREGNIEKIANAAMGYAPGEKALITAYVRTNDGRKVISLPEDIIPGKSFYTYNFNFNKVEKLTIIFKRLDVVFYTSDLIDGEDWMVDSCLNAGRLEPEFYEAPFTNEYTEMYFSLGMTKVTYKTIE